MSNLQHLSSLRADWERARNAVRNKRSKTHTWLEEEIKLPRKNPEGYERLRIDLGLRTMELGMLNDGERDHFAVYLQERDEERARNAARAEVWNRILAFFMLLATLAIAAAAIGQWWVILNPPPPVAPTSHPNR